jgi:hypothetical protein
MPATDAGEPKSCDRLLAIRPESVTPYVDGNGPAILERWLDPRPDSNRVNTALLTEGGCVASSADTVDGKRIFQVLAYNLTSDSASGATAYEALYWDRPDEVPDAQRLHLGVFFQRRFVFELDENKLHWQSGERIEAEPDFTMADGRIIPSEAVMKNPPVFGAPVPSFVVAPTARRRLPAAVPPKAPVAAKPAPQAMAKPGQQPTSKASPQGGCANSANPKGVLGAALNRVAGKTPTQRCASTGAQGAKH